MRKRRKKGMGIVQMSRPIVRQEIAMRLAGVVASCLTLVACAGGQQTDNVPPTSAPIVTMDRNTCVNVAGTACAYHFEFKAVDCADVPISGVSFARCLQTERFLWDGGGAQKFEAVTSGDDPVHVSYQRAFGFRGGQRGTFSVVSITSPTEYELLDGKVIPGKNGKLLRDDRGNNFGYAIELNNQPCVAYYQLGPRAFDGVAYLWSAAYLKCTKAGGAPDLADILAVKERLQFR
jgi:hypothetical protein